MDGSNEKDDLFEEYAAMCRIVTENTKVNFIDIRGPIIKYLEHFNK